MASELGRQLAALRRPKRKTCALPGCEVEFETVSNRLYCTPQHAKYAWFLAHRAKKRQERHAAQRQEGE
jgi:hypothetical protein